MLQPLNLGLNQEVDSLVGAYAPNDDNSRYFYLTELFIFNVLFFCKLI